jgi:hypothetical protein
VPERRVRGQRLEERQPLAHPVERGDRGLGIGHPHVHVDAAEDRLPQRPAGVVTDGLVPAPVPVADLAERRGGMQAGAEQLCQARAEHRGAEGTQRRGGLLGRRAGPGGELDHPVAQLAQDAPGCERPA